MNGPAGQLTHRERAISYSVGMGPRDAAPIHAALAVAEAVDAMTAKVEQLRIALLGEMATLRQTIRNAS